MRILGVDPGLQITGYGVISVPDDILHGQEMELVEAGVVRAETRLGIAVRLRRIHDALSDVISELKPNRLVIEKLYAHYKHPATAILMGHARGVVCLLSGTHRLPLTSIAATHVKKSITGKGHAGKLQVQKMVQHTLRLKGIPEPSDAADALAIAISYAFSLRGKRLV